MNEPNIIKAPLIQDNMAKGPMAAEGDAAHLRHGEGLMAPPREAENDVNKQDTDTSDQQKQVTTGAAAGAEPSNDQKQPHY